MFNGKFRIQKKYIAFLTVVPLVTITSLIQVDCPVSKGTGYLQATPEMESVEIVKSESQELYVTREICEQFIAYKYGLALNIKNHGDTEAAGWIKLILRQTARGKVMDIQYLRVAIPGLSAIEANYIIWFGTGLDLPGSTEVATEVVTGKIPCQLDQGTGHISLNTWLLAKGFKDNFEETIRVQKEYKPPIYFPPPTEAGGYAE